MKRINRLASTALGIAAFAMSARPATCQEHDMMNGEWPALSVEAFAGYQPATGWVRDDLSYGLRAGINFSRLGLEIGYERLESSLRPSALPQTTSTDVDADLEFIDLSLATYRHLPGGHLLLLRGGLGTASLDVDRWPFNPADDPTDDFFTLHAGASLRRFLGQSRVYLRPDVNVRWIKEKDDYRISLSLAIGGGTKQTRPSLKSNPRCGELRWEFEEIRPQIAEMRIGISELDRSVTALSETEEAMCQTTHTCYDELKRLQEAAAKCKDRRRFPDGEIDILVDDLRRDLQLRCGRDRDDAAPPPPGS